MTYSLERAKGVSPLHVMSNWLSKEILLNVKFTKGIPPLTMISVPVGNGIEAVCILKSVMSVPVESSTNVNQPPGSTGAFVKWMVSKVPLLAIIVSSTSLVRVYVPISISLPITEADGYTVCEAIEKVIWPILNITNTEA
jgi:hypothetical protein